MIGRNLMDRPFVPVGFYLNSEVPYPRVCASVGLRETPNGTLIGFEEAAGSSLIYGAIVGSRLIFPPRLRNSGLARIVENIMKHCILHPLDDIEEFEFDGSLPRWVLDRACKLVTPNCHGPMIGWWTFVPDVKSRGKISINPVSQQFDIDPGYLQDPRDLESLHAGLSAILKTVESAKPHLDEIMRKGRTNECAPPNFLSLQASLSTIYDMLLISEYGQDPDHSEILNFLTQRENESLSATFPLELPGELPVFRWQLIIQNGTKLIELTK